MKLLAVHHGSSYHIARVGDVAVGLGVRVPAGGAWRGYSDWEGYLMDDRGLEKVLSSDGGRWTPLPKDRFEVREIDGGLSLEEKVALVGFPAWTIQGGAVLCSSCPTEAGKVLGPRGERVKALSRWLGRPVRYSEGVLLWGDAEVPDGELIPHEGRNSRGGTRRGFRVNPAVLRRIPQGLGGELRGIQFGPSRPLWVAPWVDKRVLLGVE